MDFTWFLSKKIAFGKNNKNNLSQIIIKIGQCTVAIGIIVSILTVSIGIGAKKAIKTKMSDFNGHISIKSYDTNNSFNSSKLDTESINFEKIKENNNIVSIQKFATKTGVIRTEKNFGGVIMKGVSSDFNPKYFEEFLIDGKIPKYNNNSISNDVIISQKISSQLELAVDSSFVMFFIKDGEKPIYRRFNIKGIYQTDIKPIDEVFIIGDIQHIQRLNGWNSSEIGGLNLFIKDIENIDNVYSEIETFVGFDNSAEKATTTYSQINSWIQLFDTNIIIILSIMLIVVLINIVMVLLILIIERTSSIGLLKTLGSTNTEIRKIFVNYTLFIMVPGLIIGNVIAISLLYIQKIFKLIKLDPDNYFVSSVPVHINLFQIGAISVILIVISGFVLLIPSYFISKISPIKSIKFQ